MSDVIDAEVVEDDPLVPASTELVRRERRSEVIRPFDAATLLESFNAYQDLLPRLLTNEDWQGPPNKKGSFVKKSGWRKIATAFDLDVTLLRSTIERDEHGAPLRAEVWARAIAPSGRSMDGDGYCAATEPRFAEAKGRQKLENDLRATATTRAMNRAISGLVGMGAVSADEVEEPAPPSAPATPWATLAPDAQIASTKKAIAFLLDIETEPELPEDHPEVLALMTKLLVAGGGFPQVSMNAIVRVAIAVRDKREREIFAGTSDSDNAADDALAAAEAGEMVNTGAGIPESL